MVCLDAWYSLSKSNISSLCPKDHHLRESYLFHHGVFVWLIDVQYFVCSQHLRYPIGPIAIVGEATKPRSYLVRAFSSKSGVFRLIRNRMRLKVRLQIAPRH